MDFMSSGSKLGLWPIAFTVRRLPRPVALCQGTFGPHHPRWVG